LSLIEHGDLITAINLANNVTVKNRHSAIVYFLTAVSQETQHDHFKV